MKSIFYVEETFLYLHYQSFSLGNRGSNETIAFLESAPRKTIMERVIQKRKGIPNLYTWYICFNVSIATFLLALVKLILRQLHTKTFTYKDFNKHWIAIFHLWSCVMCSILWKVHVALINWGSCDEFWASVYAKWTACILNVWNHRAIHFGLFIWNINVRLFVWRWSPIHINKNY